MFAVGILYLLGKGKVKHGGMGPVSAQHDAKNYAAGTGTVLRDRLGLRG